MYVWGSRSTWLWRRRAKNFDKTESLSQRYVGLGFQLNSDQAFRLFCSKGHIRARDHLENSYFYSPSPYAYNDVQYTRESAKNSCCVLIHEEKMANTKYIEIASVSTASVDGPVCFFSIRQQVGTSSSLQSSTQQSPSLLPSPGDCSTLCNALPDTARHYHTL